MPGSDGPLAFLPFVGLLLAAVSIRILPWREVFAPDRIRFLADSDPHYHVLRAKRIVEHFPSIPWRDPAMNYPEGADILWPPLFDLLIAVPGWMLGGQPATVERVAAVLPVVLAVVSLVIVVALGRALLGAREGLIAMAVIVFLPAGVEYTVLGRPDQHALEMVTSGWVSLAFIWSWRNARLDRGRRLGSALALGFGITTAFWTWQGSGLYLLLLAGFVGSWHVVRGGDEGGCSPAAALALGSAAGVFLLAVSLLLVAPGALGVMRLAGVTGFHAMLVALTGAFSALLWAASRRRGSRGLLRRWAEVALASAFPIAITWLTVPGFSDGVWSGLTALAASNPWYATIDEFRPLLVRGGLGPNLQRLVGHFGLALVCLPLCAVAFARRWQREPDARGSLAFLAYWAVVLVILMLARVRFHLYALVPVALCVGLALEELARWVRGRLGDASPTLAGVIPVVGVAVIVAPAVPLLAFGQATEGRFVAQSAPVLRWLRAVPPSGPRREAVMASWNLGHAIQYFAGKPVVVTPFGTDGGAGAMEAAAAFYLAPSAAAAERALEHRRIGFVLVSNPASDVRLLSAFAAEPGAGSADPGVPRGERLATPDAYWQLPVSRLHFRDGSGSPQVGLPALGRYRLLFETPPARPRESPLKLFGFVPGAVVVIDHARPQGLVTAETQILTNAGRAFRWATTGHADGGGQARLRIPYATGYNGATRTGALAVTDGVGVAEVTVTEAQVVDGLTLAVDLRPASTAADRRPRR